MPSEEQRLGWLFYGRPNAVQASMPVLHEKSAPPSGAVGGEGGTQVHVDRAIFFSALNPDVVEILRVLRLWSMPTVRNSRPAAEMPNSSRTSSRFADAVDPRTRDRLASHWACASAESGDEERQQREGVAVPCHVVEVAVSEVREEAEESAGAADD